MTAAGEVKRRGKKDQSLNGFAWGGGFVEEVGDGILLLPELASLFWIIYRVCTRVNKYFFEWDF